MVDGIFSYVTRPLTVWLSKKKLFERVRRWVTSLGPYPSLALFAVPLIVLEPAKPFSGYLIGTGHFFAGALVFIAAEVLKLTVVERLFQLNKKKLLSNSGLRVGLRVLAANDGVSRIDQGLASRSPGCRQRRRMASSAPLEAADLRKRLCRSCAAAAMTVATLGLPRRSRLHAAAHAATVFQGCSNETLFADHVHPNEKGQALVARIVARTVGARLSRACGSAGCPIRNWLAPISALLAVNWCRLEPAP